MSQKLKYHQNWNIIKTKTSTKLKYHHKLNVTKTFMSPKLKMSSKSKSKSPTSALIALALLGTLNNITLSEHVWKSNTSTYLKIHGFSPTRFQSIKQIQIFSSSKIFILSSNIVPPVFISLDWYKNIKCLILLLCRAMPVGAFPPEHWRLLQLSSWWNTLTWDGRHPSYNDDPSHSVLLSVGGNYSVTGLFFAWSETALEHHISTYHQELSTAEVCQSLCRLTVQPESQLI